MSDRSDDFHVRFHECATSLFSLSFIITMPDLVAAELTVTRRHLAVERVQYSVWSAVQGSGCLVPVAYSPVGLFRVTLITHTVGCDLYTAVQRALYSTLLYHVYDTYRISDHRISDQRSYESRSVLFICYQKK